MQFVRHYMRRNDRVLPTIVTVATLPIILADGQPAGAGRNRPRPAGYGSKYSQRSARSSPTRRTAPAGRVKAAMQFLTDQWLFDVATDYAGKCTIIAAALNLIERSLLRTGHASSSPPAQRRRQDNTLTMLIMAVTGIHPAASAWLRTRRNAARRCSPTSWLAVSYILWDNIVRGAQIACPHIEKSCTAAYYADRKLGVCELVAPQPRPSTCSPAITSAPKATWPPAACRPLDVDPRRSREPRFQTPGPHRMDRQPPRRDHGRGLHDPARQPTAQGGA